MKHTFHGPRLRVQLVVFAFDGTRDTTFSVKVLPQSAPPKASFSMSGKLGRQVYHGPSFWDAWSWVQKCTERPTLHVPSKLAKYLGNPPE